MYEKQWLTDFKLVVLTFKSLESIPGFYNKCPYVDIYYTCKYIIRAKRMLISGRSSINKPAPQNVLLWRTLPSSDVVFKD